MTDDLIAEAVQRLAIAALNARSVRRRITGESPHDPLPPLDNTLGEIERAVALLNEHRATA